ncbi:MAG: hypothetical protein KF773_42415 [Deltaproteobacteria bacterium]|nr:hypothetical protein [Deltaproteobacteria bacterium]MCW5808949.1 hypothetical protein [Deltaproteobacteria bacterium]
MSAITEDERLTAEAAEIEHLLDEIRALVTAPAWQRIERALGRVVRLYGAGLGRALEHARAAGAEPAVFDELVAGDDLLGSLLVLHGLHPRTLDERVRGALATAREELGVPEDELELVAISGGRVELRAAHALGGGAMSARVAEGAIRKVIEAVAPEITAVEILGPAPRGQERDPSLVQLRARREGP